MSDYHEIDFLKIGDKRSGDAICIRYKANGESKIHVVDGGYKEDGTKVVSHIEKYFGTSTIDHVVATHPDGDHASGLQAVIEECEVGALWMNRPWDYAEELMPRFSRYTNPDNLRAELRSVFPYLAALEDLAISKNVPIYDALQGVKIGEFTVLGPTKELFLDCVVDCDRTPTASTAEASKVDKAFSALVEAARSIAGEWGVEVFPSDDTTPRNAMSVVQTVELDGTRTVLTGDAGRAGLTDAADYAENLGIVLPIKGRMQVPHHGSRHNVDSETLDRWLGTKIASGSPPVSTAVVSAAENDDDHPRKVVVRAYMHRGAEVLTTEKAGICCSGGAAPNRPGWSPAAPLGYPTDYEEL